MVSSVKIVQKAVIFYNDKVLVIKRSPTDKVRPNCWDFPGGNVDNEDIGERDNNILTHALVREVKEEVGMQIVAKDLRIIYINDGWKNDKNGLFIWIGYKVNTDSEQKVILSEEHSEYRWVNKEEFFKLDFGSLDLFNQVGKLAFET